MEKISRKLKILRFLYKKLQHLETILKRPSSFNIGILNKIGNMNIILELRQNLFTICGIKEIRLNIKDFVKNVVFS